MSELLPDEDPVVLKAEQIVHQAYEQHIDRQQNYRDARDTALLVTGLGTAALAFGYTVLEFPPNQLSFAADTIGYLYGGIGAGALAAAPFMAFSALIKRRKAKATD